jgi:uncharacterized protein YjbJ (UPF0337 family)
VEWSIPYRSTNLLWTNNPDLEDEGTAEKVAGKIQKKVGQVERVIEKS